MVIHKIKACVHWAEIRKSLHPKIKTPLKQAKDSLIYFLALHHTLQNVNIALK